jgi:phospholipid N-methyltransferase
MSQFLKSPRSIGTILPSSRELAELMIEPIDFETASTIVEFGPGTGTITALVAKKLKPQTRYIGIERNEKFCDDLKAKFPQLTFVNRSAGDVEEILKSFNIDSVDAILCGIPWASLPAGVQPEILNGVQKSLKPGGVFVTFAYVSGLMLPAAWELRQELKTRFSSVTTTRVIWNNFPPAFTYVCHR